MKNSAVRFLVFTFGSSWAIWITVAIAQPILNPPMSILVPVVILGAFAPSIVGSLMGGVFAPKETRRDFWSRALSVRRIGWAWWLFILLFSPAIAVAVIGLNWALGDGIPGIDPTIFAGVGALLGFVVFQLLGGPLAEELGWRGFLLDRLLSRWSVMKASLIMGVIWVLWHVPLFFIEGTAQHAQGIWDIKGLQWTIEVLCTSIIVSMVYINTNRSSLGAVMLHFMGNATFTAFAGSGYALTTQIGVLNTIVNVVFTGVILLLIDRTSFRFPRTSKVERARGTEGT